MTRQRRIRVSAVTDIGKKRVSNEDCIGAIDTILQSTCGQFNLEFQIGQSTTAVVIADGVGGGRGGGLAAMTAVRTFLSRCDAVSNSTSLVALVGEVSEHVRLTCAQSTDTSGGSTTIAGLVFTEGELIAFNVGDSRIYEVGENGLTILSHDHVSGKNTRMVTRFLGHSGVAAQPYWRHFSISPTKRFLLCTDGLHGVIDSDQIEHLLRIPVGPSAAEALVDAALSCGGPDNVTVAVCDCLNDS